jgi:carbonic anhydrase
MDSHPDLLSPEIDCVHERRRLIKSAVSLTALGVIGLSWIGFPQAANALALTKEARDRLTADEVIEAMRKGNERFRTGRMASHDYIAQKRATAAGQFPAAVVLSCIDSRAPVEVVFDARIGDTFSARVAGNVVDDDVLGSLEFACELSGAKVLLVMGHTACGAIKGAIDSAELGHLTQLLKKIKPAVTATEYDGTRSSKNGEFVDQVAKTNVVMTIDAIRRASPVLAVGEKSGRLKMVGAMYHLVGGRVEFL